MLVNESSEKTALADLGSDLAKDLAKLEGQQDVFNSDLRHEVVRKARQVLLEVSSPLQFMMMQVSNFHIYVAVRTLAMHGVFKNIPATKAISIDDLANKTAMPAPLLRRQVRLLAVAQILIEESLDHFAHTRLSRQYSEAEDLHSMLEVVNERVTRSMSTLPDYVAARKLAPEEEDHQHCPFTWSRGKDGTSVWDIMAETGELSRFQTGLNPSNKNFPTVGFYDFASLAQGDLGGRDVLVDVGGGIGQVLTAIINSAPEMLSVASKCVLQDLEGPVGQAQSLGHLPSGVRTMPHSFFNEQPIKGAKAYYLRRVLHDYSDSACISILKHLADAAAPDSRILISELIDPGNNTEAEIGIICIDLNMFNIGGQERTERQFEQLLHSAGLQLMKVWKGPTDYLIEAMPIKAE